MSTTIRTMSFVMNLLTFLFSAAIVRSDQSKVPLRSFKLGGNVTYDCIDIYKQPGLDHTLLKTHKIQMKPTVSRTEFKNHTRNNNPKIGCPNGTVPILRTTKEFITNSQHFAEQYIHPLSADNPGTHIAGVKSHSGPFHGVESWFNGYIINIGRDQALHNQIYIGSGLNKEINFISTGGMINPSLFGDGRVWTYGFWKGKNGRGCYNLACPGFVQVSHDVPLVRTSNLKPGIAGWLRLSIHQDKNTGNWWVSRHKMPKGPIVDIGYWPKELFNLLDNGANMAGVGGVAQSSQSGSSPPLGNGKFPTGDITKFGAFTNIEVLDSNYKQRKMTSFPIEKLLDSTKCYGLRIGKAIPFYRVSDLGFYFTYYGGPGGNSCGISPSVPL